MRQLGIDISASTVARLLYDMRFSLRANRKSIATHSSPDRNQQFEYIASLKNRFKRQHLPIVSVDSKKREMVGNFKNNGSKWDLAPVEVNDHDFLSDATGVALPFGVYDVSANRGAVIVGVSHDTPAFAVHSIAQWWQLEGAARYRNSRQLLILADGGGSNGCRPRAWKTELQSQLSNSFGLSVTVAHYPTGTSKYNPIEHRLFSEIQKNWAAEPLTSYQKILNFIRTTSTKSGLAVTAYLDRKKYETGQAPDDESMRKLRITRAKILPAWNYSISPQM